MCFVVCKEWKAEEKTEMSRVWAQWEADYRANFAQGVEDRVMGEVWEEIEILAARRRDAVAAPPANRSNPYPNMPRPPANRPKGSR